MVTRPPDLPDYDNPPVVEVALSVRFEPLAGLRTAHIGLLWSRFRDSFPRLEEHPPLPLAPEEFDGKGAPQVQIQFGPPPLNRQWFLNQEGTQLLQVQSDGFMHNWRQATPEDAYPRYEQVRERFLSYLSQFQQFLAEETLGEIVPVQCEVTYVNHIEAGGGWGTIAEIQNLFPAWAGHYSDSFLPEPEDVRFAVRFVIPGETGEPLGRLHISCQPAIRQALFIMEILGYRGFRRSSQIRPWDRGRWRVRHAPSR